MPMFEWKKEFSNYSESIKSIGMRPFKEGPALRKMLGDELHILVFQDIFYSMLALSPKTYTPYIYDWGKYIGTETTKQSLRATGIGLKVELESKLFYMNMLDDKSVQDVLFKWMAYYRIGVPEITFVDKVSKTFRIEVDELMNSWGMPNIHKRTCYFPTGFLAGAFETVLEHPVNIVESKCVSNGDEHCEFGGAVELPEHKFDIMSDRDFVKIRKSIYDRMFVEKRSRPKLSDWAHLVMLQIFYTGVLLSSHGGHTMLYWIGRNSGKEIGSRIKAKDFDGKMKKFIDILNYLKIGKAKCIRCKPCTECKGSVRFVVKESAFSIGTKFGKKIDSYIAGMLSGFLETCTKKKQNVIETKCISNGDEHCEFVVI